MMVSFRAVLVLWLSTTGVAYGWKTCDDDTVCPDHATCCPTSTAGVSSCMSSKQQDPENGGGHCCSATEGCPYGFTCAVNDTMPYCQIDPDAPKYLSPYDTPRYQLCQVTSPEQRTWKSFPMTVQNQTTFQVAYYSNMGDIKKPSTAHLQVETILVLVHGSARNVDDYFCTGLSLFPNETGSSSNVLLVAPLFASPEDVKSDATLPQDLLVWADHDNSQNPNMLSHSWRYGADAMNAAVSSYAVIDALVGYFAEATIQYPKLQRISVAGHSAGGQTVHRWSLLSNNPAFENDNIRIQTVAANPRSYCYLDNRRVVSNEDDDDDDSYQVKVPDVDDIAVCPNYNHWQWGLQEGGTLLCPYKDRALEQTPLEQLVYRYITQRNVAYLAGQYDTIPLHDRCETSHFQGQTRFERAQNYVQRYLPTLNASAAAITSMRHTLHVVLGSPHDHTLMFQSPQGRQAIFGTPQGSLA